MPLLYYTKVGVYCQLYSLSSRGHCLNTCGWSLCLKDLYYLHRFVTRPDVKQKRLGDFLDWCLTTISQTSELTMEGTVALDGALQSLVSLQSTVYLTYRAVYPFFSWELRCRTCKCLAKTIQGDSHKTPWDFKQYNIYLSLNSLIINDTIVCINVE